MGSKGAVQKVDPALRWLRREQSNANLLGRCEADLSQTNLRVSGIVNQCGSGRGSGALINTLEGKSLRRSHALADEESLLYCLCPSLYSDPYKKCL